MLFFLGGSSFLGCIYDENVLMFLSLVAADPETTLTDRYDDYCGIPRSMVLPPDVYFLFDLEAESPVVVPTPKSLLKLDFVFLLVAYAGSAVSRVCISPGFMMFLRLPRWPVAAILSLTMNSY